MVLKLSSNAIGDSNYENNLPHKLSITDTQVSRFHKAFVNNSLANIKSSKNQLHKIGKSDRFLGSFLGPLLKTSLPPMENVLKTLAKSVLILLALTATASANDAEIHKKMFGFCNTTLIISSKEMNDIMKIVK